MKSPADTAARGDLKIRRALISVSDKRGIVEFAQALRVLGVEIISTGGTHAMLQQEKIPATRIADVTGFPEILDGRVKTLHPAIHAGLLAVLDNPLHVKQLGEHHIQPIDLVVVNLYPFKETISESGVSLEEAIEQIDIGGPAMVRASAKNYRHTAAVVNPDRYDEILRELHDHQGNISESTRYSLACEAFQHTAHYDQAIASYLALRGDKGKLPDLLTLSLRKSLPLRYGENPHQAAAFYGDFHGTFERLHGKELSYNNILDVHAAVALCREFDDPAVVIVKHNNPCGVATSEDPLDAYTKALATDSKSAFGGIVAFNREVTESVAESMNALFLEVIVAPGFSPDALQILKKKKDRRLLQLKTDPRTFGDFDIRRVLGGYLVQESDHQTVDETALTTVTKRRPSESELRALLFAWRVAKHAKSNAIVYARRDRTLGIGAGQMSRVDSSKIAAMKAEEAGLDLKGCAVASDAFFPFPDGLLEAVRAGATAVIQPGGSVRDTEVIQAADDHHLAMVFTGIRHFRH